MFPLIRALTKESVRRVIHKNFREKIR